MGSDQVIHFPGYEELKKETEQLRTQVAARIQERDELRYLRAEELETEYQKKFGELEYQISLAEYETQCQKRTAELILAAKRRQKEPDLDRIGRRVELELAERCHQIENQARKLQRNRYYGERDLSAAALNRDISAQFYRIIVRAIHPNLNPEASDEEQQLFYLAVTAYKQGDVDTLHTIYGMLGANDLLGAQDTMKRQYRERARLAQVLQTVEEEIRQIRSEYPFTMEVWVSTPYRVGVRRKELRAQLEQRREEERLWREKVRELLGL